MRYDVLDELANEDLLDLEFTFTKPPSINNMDITSTVLPVSQVYRNPVVSRMIRDHSAEYEEMEVTLSSAMNSSSFQRRNVKAGVKGDSHAQPLLPGGFTLMNSLMNEQSGNQDGTTERELCSETVLQLLNQTVVPSSLPCTLFSLFVLPPQLTCRHSRVRSYGRRHFPQFRLGSHSLPHRPKAHLRPSRIC